MASPLEKFKQEHAERWKVLHDIPAWEIEDILHWLKLVFADSNGLNLRRNALRAIESRAKLLFSDDLGIPTYTWDSIESALRVLLREKNYDRFLIFLDCAVLYIRDWAPQSSIGYVQFGDTREVQLSKILRYLDNLLENGSKWKVAPSGAGVGIVERTNEQLTELAKGLNNEHLTKAWNDAFGIKPEPGKAIEQAQKAIEQAASDAGLTNATSSIFGTLLGDAKAHPDKYTSAATAAYELMDQIGIDPRETHSTNESFAGWFARGMDLIQRSNPEHHPSAKTKDFKLDPETGKQAVLIATTLCELIKSGYFKKIAEK